MKREPKPIQISPEVAARCDGSDQAERMDALFRAVISVPHSTIVKEEEKWKRARAKQRTKH
jgi:hypothetical protein